VIALSWPSLRSPQAVEIRKLSPNGVLGRYSREVAVPAASDARQTGNVGPRSAFTRIHRPVIASEMDPTADLIEKRAWLRLQFSVGLSSRSITIESMGPCVDSSLNPK
jgi:hypothetical protein